MAIRDQFGADIHVGSKTTQLAVVPEDAGPHVLLSPRRPSRLRWLGGRVFLPSARTYNNAQSYFNGGTLPVTSTIGGRTVTLKDEERQPCEIWTRIMGYYRTERDANIGKRQEIRERHMYRERDF
jgi:hypothetical protein